MRILINIIFFSGDKMTIIDRGKLSAEGFPVLLDKLYSIIQYTNYSRKNSQLEKQSSQGSIIFRASYCLQES